MINYNINKSIADQIRKHLERCSIHFYPALSTYVNINDYSVKLKHKATRFEAWNNKEKRLESFTGISEAKYLPAELKEYIKYRTLIDINSVTEYKNLMDVYLTARYLESLNIKYYFINASYNWLAPDQFKEPKLTKQYQILYDAYGDRRHRHLAFSSQEDRFWQYMRENKIPVSEHSKWEHWGVEGQKFWKENIKAWMARIDNV